MKSLNFVTDYECMKGTAVVQKYHNQLARYSTVFHG